MLFRMKNSRESKQLVFGAEGAKFAKTLRQKGLDLDETLDSVSHEEVIKVVD